MTLGQCICTTLARFKSTPLLETMTVQITWLPMEQIWSGHALFINHIINSYKALSYFIPFDHLRNKFDFWSFFVILNISGLLQKAFTLQETQSTQDSMNRQKLNLLLIFTFYIISQVSIFNFHLTWLVFQIFWIKSNIKEDLEWPKRQISVLSFMATRVQCHANFSKQETLLDGVDVGPLKWRICRCGLNWFFQEGMNSI